MPPIQWTPDLLQLVTGLAIFVLRFSDVCLDTLRVSAMWRGQTARVVIFGFFEATIFVLVIAVVVRSHLGPLPILCYAAAFAAGNFLGMRLARRLSTDYRMVRVLSPRQGEPIAQALREAGFAVTSIEAKGRDGDVGLLFSVVELKEAKRVLEIVREVDPRAFVLSEPVDRAMGGFIPQPQVGGGGMMGG